MSLVLPGGAPFWQVSAGATPPYQVSVFGAGPAPLGGGAGTFFNDSAAVSSLMRSATVACGRQSDADTHCDAALPQSFATGTRLTSIELLAQTPRLYTSHLAALWILR